VQILNIGRNNSNTIVLNDDMVSRQHAQLILMNNGQVLIKDLGSTNGTFVNGNRIRECYLKPADIVKCAGIFLDWSQYITGNEALIAQRQHRLQSDGDDDFNKAADFENIKNFTWREILRYITSRIFNAGDLFRSDWNNTSPILFFLLIPLFGTLSGGLLYYFTNRFNLLLQPELNLLNLMLQISAVSVSCFGISQLVTLILLTINRETTLRKNLLATSIFSFLEFLILVVTVSATFIIGKLTDENLIISILPHLHMYSPGSGNWVLLAVVYTTAYTLIISITITLILFIYNYFRSIDVSKGMSIHLTVLSLAICLLAQFCFFYLIKLLPSYN